KLALGQTQIDALFRGVDLLLHISKRNEDDISQWEAEHAAEIQQLLEALKLLIAQENPAIGSPAGPAIPLISAEALVPADSGKAAPVPATTAEAIPEAAAGIAPRSRPESTDRVLRLTAENLNRLLGLAGESLVESRWLRPFADSLQRLKRQQTELAQRLDRLRQGLEDEHLSERHAAQLHDLRRQVGDSQQFLTERMEELDLYDRRSA